MRTRGILLAGAVTIGVAAPAFAQLPVPTPKIELPVPVPTVQVPVPVPTVRLPIPTPQVSVPTTAPTSAPTAAPPAPTAAPPAATAAPPTSGSAPASGGSSSSSGGSSSSSSGGGGSSSAPSSSRATQPKRSASQPARRTTSRPAASGGGSSPAKPVNKRDRKLQSAVAKASGCLDDLSTAQRKVLSARAGVGAASPSSRTAVARRFDITVKRVVRLERTGLRRLRSLAKSGGCAPPVTMTTTTAGALPPASAAAAAPAAKGREPRKPSEVGRETRAGGDDETPAGGVDAASEKNRGGVAGVTQTNLPGSNGGGFSLTIPLILLALALTALLVARVLRRDRPEPVVAAGDDPDPEPVRATWVPWHRSTMTGPSWHDTPPEVEQERQQSAPAEHEPWEPSRSRTRR